MKIQKLNWDMIVGRALGSSTVAELKVGLLRVCKLPVCLN